MKAYRLHQKLNTTYTEVSHTYTTSAKANSWAVGPRIALGTNWLLGSGFRIYGDTAASLVYQHIKADYSDYQDDTIDHYVTYRNGQITPNFDLGAGFGWGTYFADNGWHFDMILGYEFQYFWNQNWMRWLKDNEALFIDGDAGDLMFQGLTVGIRFDF